MAFVYHADLDRTVEVTDDQAVIMRSSGWVEVNEPRGDFVDPLEEARPPLEEPIPLEHTDDIDAAAAIAVAEIPAEEAEEPTTSEEDD
jgi:hypothetical protein